MLRASADRGSVTAEFAVAVVGAVIVCTFLLGGLRVGAAQVACTDAAGTAARLAGRGETTALVDAAAVSGCGRLASRVAVGEYVCVTVAGTAGLAGSLVALPVEARACAVRSTR